MKRILLTRTTRPRADLDIFSEIGPPETVQVAASPRVVLYRPDGVALIRQIGFQPTLKAKD
jgi:hypothetical protein